MWNSFQAVLFYMVHILHDTSLIPCLLFWLQIHLQVKCITFIWSLGYLMFLVFSLSWLLMNIIPLTFSLPSTLLLASSCIIIHLPTTVHWCNRMQIGQGCGSLYFHSLNHVVMVWCPMNISGLSKCPSKLKSFLKGTKHRHQIEKMTK